VGEGMSKGSKQRPIQVSRKEFDKKWDQIFKKKPQKEPVDKNYKTKQRQMTELNWDGSDS